MGANNPELNDTEYDYTNIPSVYQAPVEPTRKGTYAKTGLKRGAALFTLGNIGKLLLSKKPVGIGHALTSTAGSAVFGGMLGGIGGSLVRRGSGSKHIPVEKTSSQNTVKENDYIMNMDLYNACEFAKYAADMSVPLEEKPAPEAGSEPVAGMTDNSTFNPTSVGEATYASQSGALELQKAKELAACVAAKTAADESVASKIPDYALGAGALGGLGYGAYQLGIAAPERMHRYGVLARNVSRKRGAIGLGAAGALYGAKKLYDRRQAKTAADSTTYAASARKHISNAVAAANRRLSNIKDTVSSFGRRNATAGKEWVAANPKKSLAAGATAAVAAYGAKQLYDKYKNAPEYDHEAEYTDKLASVGEYGVTPEEAAMAIDAAVTLYDDCMDKLAFAQDLYNEATDYLDYVDAVEKTANDYMALPSSALGTAAGITAGEVVGQRFGHPRMGTMIGGMVGGALGAAVPTALEHFAATTREEE